MRWIKASGKDLVDMGRKHWRDAKSKEPIGAGLALASVIRTGINEIEVLDESLVSPEEGNEMVYKENKPLFFAVEYGGWYHIQNEPYYTGKDILNAEDVGIVAAENNANLIVELLNKHYHGK